METTLFHLFASISIAFFLLYVAMVICIVALSNNKLSTFIDCLTGEDYLGTVLPTLWVVNVIYGFVWLIIITHHLLF